MANNDAINNIGGVQSSPVAQSPHLGLIHEGDLISQVHALEQDKDFDSSPTNETGLMHANGDEELLRAQAAETELSEEHMQGQLVEHMQGQLVEHMQGHLVEHMSIYDDSDKHGNVFSQTGEGESNSSQGGYHDADQDDGGFKNHDDDVNGLAVLESDLDETIEKLQLMVDQNHDMEMEPSTDLGDEHSQLMLTPPVLQSRIVAPTHELSVGQEFPDVQSCRRALREVAIALHFEIQTIKSDKTRFTAKCASEGCPWRIHAAKLPGVPTFSIRTIHKEHTCSGIAHLGHQQASVQWVAKSVEQRLREDPMCKPKEILEEIHREYGIALSYKQAWRGKERIMATLRGSFEEDFKLLPQYCDQIRKTNPGSIAAVYVTPTDNCFHRLFISFQASIFGFLNACRPLIGLDRTILKNKYLGTMLMATSFDGDGALFPIAFAVVDEESDENWMWFLSELHFLLETNTENMPRLTILSDRQKGVIDAVEANFPTAFHGFCLRHLSESFQKEFNNPALVSLLVEAANALTSIECENRIHDIEEASEEAGLWLRQVPSRLWATAYFEGTRFGQLTANAPESMNSWLLEASALPLIQMMECIRRQLMTWFNERREASMEWTSVLVPSAERRVADAIERARAFHVLRASDAEFTVITNGGSNNVDIRNRRCYCQGWQLNGLPCAHAVAALLSCRQNVHRFTENCFTIASYRKAYSQTIHPIPDRTLWKEMEMELLENGESQTESTALSMIVNPPKTFRPSGQPRKRRARSDERGRAKRVVHCSRCNQTGHFRTTCAAPV